MFGLHILFHGQSFQAIIPKSVEACKNSLVSHLDIRQRGIKGAIYEFSPLENEEYRFWFHELFESRVLIIFRGLLQEQDDNTTMVTATAYIHFTNLVPALGAIFFIYFLRMVIPILIFGILVIFMSIFGSIGVCSRAEEIFIDLTSEQARKQKM